MLQTLLLLSLLLLLLLLRLFLLLLLLSLLLQLIMQLLVMHLWGLHQRGHLKPVGDRRDGAGRARCSGHHAGRGGIIGPVGSAASTGCVWLGISQVVLPRGIYSGWLYRLLE